MSKWINRMLGRSALLQPIERIVLDGVSRSLADPWSLTMERQVSEIRRVVRSESGREVSLYAATEEHDPSINRPRFPDHREEFRIATVRLSQDSSESELVADVWVANGRVFSIVFDQPNDVWPAQEATVRDIEIVSSAEILRNPSENRADEQSLRKIRSWLGPSLAGYEVVDAISAPPTEVLRSQITWARVVLPLDALKIFQVCESFRCGGIRIDSPTLCRTIVVPGGEYLVIAEGQADRLLGVRRGNTRAVIFVLEHDVPPVDAGESLHIALQTELDRMRSPHS
jgi:hypothetical protein